MERIKLLLFRPRCGDFVSEVWWWVKTREEIRHHIDNMNVPKDPDLPEWTAEVVELPLEDERFALSLAGWLYEQACIRTSEKQAASSAANAKKGGRPKKAIEPSEPAPKKPRGQPRKYAVVVPPEPSSEELAVETEPQTTPLKRPRGRPKNKNN